MITTIMYIIYKIIKYAVILYKLNISGVRKVHAHRVFQYRKLELGIRIFWSWLNNITINQSKSMC